MEKVVKRDNKIEGKNRDTKIFSVAGDTGTPVPSGPLVTFEL